MGAKRKLTELRKSFIRDLSLDSRRLEQCSEREIYGEPRVMYQEVLPFVVYKLSRVIVSLTISAELGQHTSIAVKHEIFDCTTRSPIEAINGILRTIHEPRDSSKFPLRPE